MIQQVLLNLVQLYYPNNICPWDENEKYVQTIEYKRLSSLIEFFYSDVNKNMRDAIKKEFDEDLTLKDFLDFSREDSGDRCYTFFLNVIEEGELCSITLHLSFLVPYYVIRAMKHPNQMIFSKSRLEELEKENLDTRKIKDLILKVEEIVENKLLYKKFPESIIHNTIDNVSFGDIRLGYFKMFNAFYNNEFLSDENNI